MLKPFWVDLHIHTLLSPCGELEMGAPEIVERAREAGLDVIGIADHNTCENFPGIHEAAAGVPVVLPCIETQSAEDIHILCVFPDYETAAGYKEWLWRRIRPIPNDVEHFGYQIVVDANNEIVKEEETLLIQGSSAKRRRWGASPSLPMLTVLPSHIRRRWDRCPTIIRRRPSSSPAASITRRRKSGASGIPDAPL